MSTARTVASVSTVAGRWASIVAPITSAMAGNASVPSRKDDTATSLDAFSTIGRLRSASRARNASRRHGNSSQSGGWNSSAPARVRSRNGTGAAHRSGYENAYWMGSRMSVVPSWASIDPSANSTSEWTIDCGCTTTSICAAGIPNSQCASITSRPLFMSVAESTVIFGPICQVGCRKASAGVTSARLALVRPRNGPPDAVRISRRTSRASWPRRHWWMALCSLSTGRIGTPLARARSMTRPPAITSTSLLARAIVLPASIAASTASRPIVPDDAHSTRSTSEWVATATSPSAPTPVTGGSPPTAAPSCASASAEDIETATGR